MRVAETFSILDVDISRYRIKVYLARIILNFKIKRNAS